MPGPSALFIPSFVTNDLLVALAAAAGPSKPLGGNLGPGSFNLPGERGTVLFLSSWWQSIVTRYREAYTMETYPLNPLELNPNYRDWWSEFDPNSVALLCGINKSGCFWPRFVTGPTGGNTPQGVVGPGTYVNYVMSIKPGSFIYGIFLDGVNTTGFVCQITDMALNHKWFSTPIPWNFLAGGAVFPNFSPNSPPVKCYLLPAPYPVVSPGTFLLEFWSTQASGGASTNLELTFGFAEPMEAVA